jgi:hypothetical protein
MTNLSGKIPPWGKRPPGNIFSGLIPFLNPYPEQNQNTHYFYQLGGLGVKTNILFTGGKICFSIIHILGDIP